MTTDCHVCGRDLKQIDGEYPVDYRTTRRAYLCTECKEEIRQSHPRPVTEVFERNRKSWGRGEGGALHFGT